MAEAIDLLTLDPEEALYLAPAPAAAHAGADPTVDYDLREITDPNDPEYVEPGASYEVGDLPRGTVLRGGYEGARSCAGGPEPGTKNLMSVFLERHAAHGGKNLGIYNCRSVRGAATTSIHAEGRAGDHGCGTPQEWMQAWSDLMISYSAELGIQCVIYNRRIWSSSYPDAWRPYTGLVPHTDHAHVEQTRASARTLTVARIHEILGIAGPAPAPAPGGGTWRPRVDSALGARTLRQWDVGKDVGFVQRWHGLKDDDHFGPNTEAAVRATQGRNGVGVDGIVGPVTWRLMGVGVQPAPTPAPVPVVGRPLIQKGSEGKDVRDWQEFLRAGYPAYRHESAVRRGVLLPVDGDFGDWTVAWTRLYQAKSRLKVDGKVGPATWRKAGFR